ncbi:MULTISPECIES: EAL domain-containing protein [unclassified Halomonas]|uniref:EAL domain-containing protein n=1 Tax=unclassified Halomonas TaxID=2609666 RepID=UPI0009ED069E|nr:MULTISPECIES: EAL domain-containing protein [unclassified Halomonas]MBT2788812.1 EAL domain-containing protein [Halomonas sp. ISL-106]MBT2799531.1 EAL domain-containing protein [Halomonas sp. ISL-104]
MTAATPPLAPPLVVGIGASAGGLEAIAKLIKPLDPDMSLAYVVLQHVSPTHKSMLVDILSRETRLRVRHFEDNQIPEAGVIYVVPANTSALIEDGIFYATPIEPHVVPKPCINDFFISLAADAHEAAVGIVLSGTGYDGTAGLRAIMAAGGITMVQTPASAKYSGMPQSALNAGVIDYVLDAEAMAPRLAELVQVHASHESSQAAVPERLLSLLREHRQLDFSGYKKNALSRRIRRRLIATNMADMQQYLALVESSPAELELLGRDILISVTAFVRDKAAFDALDSAISSLIEDAEREPIRIWVAGCATGEEAYSIALMIAEAKRRHGDASRVVQIFATDIDDDALEVARRGNYIGAALEALPPEWVERYFIATEQTFEVSKELRDMVVFAKHNLVDDPPFLRLNLVSCRNVLIYFNNELQARVLQRFHFGLRAKGLLFLGRSESISQTESLFTPLNRRERLFSKQGESREVAVRTTQSAGETPLQRRRDRDMQQLLDALVAHMEATVAVCDAQGSVLHAAGEVAKFLPFTASRSQVGIGDVISPAFRGELMAMLRQFQTQREPQLGRRRRFEDRWWRLSVRALAEGDDDYRVLVMITPQPLVEPAFSSDGSLERLMEPLPPGQGNSLENELVATREHLQALIEELATANEEMQSLNEEAQASNEELQATNEEMEAANEELQATNEELINLNEELNIKSGELTRLNAEYTYLYDALDFPLLVFDTDFCLKRYNAPAARYFNFRPTALQRHVAGLTLPTALSNLEEQLVSVMASGMPEEDVVEDNGRLLQRVLTPGVSREGNVELLIVTLMDITDLSHVQAKLRQSQAQLHALMENSTVMMALKDLNGRYTFANPQFLNTFDLSQDALVGRNPFEVFPEPYASSVWASDLEALRYQRMVKAEHVLTSSAGGVRIFSSVHQVLRDEQGHPNLILTEAEDITARKQAEREMQVAAKVYEQAGEAIVVINALGNVQSVNAAFTRITGFTTQQVLNTPALPLLYSDQENGQELEPPGTCHIVWELVQQNGFWQGEVWNHRQDGTLFSQWLTLNSIEPDSHEEMLYVAVFSDITHIKESQQHAEYLATHDALTGLPNRTLFQDRLQVAIAHARRNNQISALMFLDLDNFKSINDTLGHDAGDELLIQVAGRLRELVRELDTVARLGGDEFTIIISDTTIEGAEQVAKRIVEALAKPFDVRRHSLFVTSSVGLAFCPDDGDDVAGLTKAADTAMYRAKENGRDRFELFKPELQERLMRDVAIEHALREGMEQGRLRLMYQPKFTSASPHSLVGAEALLRWSDPVLGEVSPADFIPVAEATGLILELDRHVALLLITQLAQWLADGVCPPPVAMNVSARSFQEERFISHLFACLKQYRVAHELIQVEITESTLVDRSSAALGNIEKLREAGIKLAVDDFGTGYSSLAYLKRLPLAELKIDKSFVDGLDSADESDQAIALAILGMAKALNIRTVGEGVETHSQLSWLTANGCDYVQGYLLSRPLPLAEFTVLAAGYAPPFSNDDTGRNA